MTTSTTEIIAQISVCADCMIANVNDGDALVYKVNGVEFPCDTTPNFDTESGEGFEEFSDKACDNCGTDLIGERYKFAVWAWL